MACYNDDINNRETKRTRDVCGVSPVPPCPRGYSPLKTVWIPSNQSDIPFRFPFENKCESDVTEGSDRKRIICYRNESDYPSDRKSLIDCCLGNTREERCKPGYCSGSAKCRTFMMNHCSSVNNIFSKEECQDWCNQDPGSCNDLKARYCRDNIWDSNCHSWCSNQTGNSKSVCDQAITEFCKDNPEHSICSCFTSPIKMYNPACLDVKCITDGYKTTSMTSLPCPDVVDCSMQIQMERVGRDIDIGNIDLQQNCGMNQETDIDVDTTNNINSDEDTKISTDPDNTSLDKKNNLGGSSQNDFVQSSSWFDNPIILVVMIFILFIVLSLLSFIVYKSVRYFVK